MTEIIERMGSSDIPSFRISPIYDADTDSIIVYARNKPSFASRLNSRFTLFLDADDNTLVGFEIKGFSRLLKRMRQFDLFVTNSTVTLQESVKAAMFSTDGESDDSTEDRAIKSITLPLRENSLGNRTIDEDRFELLEA